MPPETTHSAELFKRASDRMPGGVSSPVRAFRSVGGTPLFVRRGEGARFQDEDGNWYLDYVQSWGPLILGHARGEVIDAVIGSAREGLSFGAPSRREIALAERVLSAYPFFDKVRFVNSGTEATMSALRLARGATGRDAVIKFEGCYHGHSDALLIAGGSGLATFGVPSSAGVPAGVVADTISLPLDDFDAVRQVFAERGQGIAAVIVEPVPANAGLLLQRREFLLELRRLTTAHGALLVFDEVISGFRVSPGGACQLFGIEPDLVCLGKIIGGGMPVGAYVGRSATMDLIAPLGPVYQAGTLSGNPVAMAAGEATLKILQESDAYAYLETLGDRLETGVRRIAATLSFPVQLVRQGSLFWFVFQEGEAPRAYHQIRSEGAARYATFHRELLKRGVYFAPSAYEVGFLSVAHTAEDVDQTLAAIDEALRETCA